MTTTTKDLTLFEQAELAKFARMFAAYERLASFQQTHVRQLVAAINSPEWGLAQRESALQSLSELLRTKGKNDAKS